MPRVLEDANLDTLLVKAGLNSYDRWTWFRGCGLNRSLLHVPTPDLATSIERCWMPQIRAVLSDCTILVTTAPVQASPVKASHAKRLWNQTAKEPTNGDLL